MRWFSWGAFPLYGFWFLSAKRFNHARLASYFRDGSDVAQNNIQKAKQITSGAIAWIMIQNAFWSIKFGSLILANKSPMYCERTWQEDGAYLLGYIVWRSDCISNTDRTVAWECLCSGQLHRKATISGLKDYISEQIPDISELHSCFSYIYTSYIPQTLAHKTPSPQHLPCLPNQEWESETHTHTQTHTHKKKRGQRERERET